MRRMLLFTAILIAVLCWLRTGRDERLVAVRKGADNGERFTSAEVESELFG